MAFFRDIVLASNPLVYYEMQETSGTNADDSSPNNRDGTYAGSPSLGNTTMPPISGHKYVVLDGTDDEIQIPVSVSLPLNSAVTVMWWQKVPTADVGARVGFSIGELAAPDRCLAHAPYSDSTLYWDYGNEAANGRTQVSYTPYLDNWRLIHLVSQGNSGVFRAIYIDGVERASGVVSDGPDQTVSGGTLGGEISGIGFAQKAQVAHFAVFASVLSQATISAHFDARVPSLPLDYRNLPPMRRVPR